VGFRSAIPLAVAAIMRLIKSSESLLRGIKVAALRKSPSASRAQASETKAMMELLAVLAPEKEDLAAIRTTARKKGKDKLSMREIDREIRAYRRTDAADPTSHLRGK